MGIVKILGSFPNSQIRPRSAVRLNDTIQDLVPSGSEKQILSANAQRVKAIIKNEGPNPLFYSYESGVALSEGFELEVGSVITVEGEDTDVFARAVGGSTNISIDDRLG